MKKIFFTPGPSQLYPTVSKHIEKAMQEDIGSISHRSAQFQEIYKDLIQSLKKLLSIPEDYHIFITGSGTEAMERIVQNCVENYSFHFVNGSFAKRFFIIANDSGKSPVSVEVPVDQKFNFKEIEIPENIELIAFTQNETSSGTQIPVEEITAVAKKYPKTLIAVDIVSAVPYVDLDYKKVDIAFFSVQKLFGLPAGLGLMIVSPRATKKAEMLEDKKIDIGSYHSFPKLLQYEQKQQTHETPPVLHMYLLGKVVTDMQKKGIENIREEIEKKASLLYDFLDQQDRITPFVKEMASRSQTVIVVDIEKTDKDVKKLLAKKGFIVGSGYGKNKTTQIRIANFPAHAVQDFKNLIRELKTL